jgi:hypothetical protein
LPLGFSVDTLKFDTIFTTLGSTTKFFTLKNNGNQSMKINEIRLSAHSNFRISVDGDTGTVFQNITIPAHDSIYIFVEITINPNAANLPFVMLDSIVYTVGQRQQKSFLQAYGQNAHFFDNDTITTHTAWTNDLPYVILNSLSVEKNATLDIGTGCKVYFGGNAALLVAGSLNIQGGNDSTNAVIFRTYRLDKDITGAAYEDFPGQWLGLFLLRGSSGNINNLILKNSQYGISVGNITTDEAENMQALQGATLSNGAHLIIRNSKIYNNSFYSIFGLLSVIEAENLLCYQAGANVLSLNYGGNYSFVNCTFYNESSAYISHNQTSVLNFNNYFINNSPQPLMADSARLEMRNSIIYGTMADEILLDELPDNPHKLYYNFSHCCIKKPNNSLSDTGFINCFYTDPQFENISKSDFRLKAGSPCINAGDDVNYFPILDIKGVPRTGKPDVGAFEN